MSTLSSSQSATAAPGETGSQSATLLSKSTGLQLRTVLWPVALRPVICERRGKSRLRLPCQSYLWSFQLGDWSLFSSSNHYGSKHSTPLCDGLCSLSCQHYCCVLAEQCHQLAEPGLGFEGMGSRAGRGNMGDLGIVPKHPLSEHQIPTSSLSCT